MTEARTFLTRLPLLGFVALLLGCGEPETAAAGADLEWQFQYEGELSGAVQGEILAVTAVMTQLTIAGGAYGDSPGRRAPQEVYLSLTLDPNGDVRSVLMKLTLPDGTTCHNTGEVTAEIRDAEKRTFDASFSGELDCDGKITAFQGWVDADP